MRAAPEVRFEFPAQYEVSVMPRISRIGVSDVRAYPGAEGVDRQRELAAGTILEITPRRGSPWIAVFDHGDYGYPPAAPRQVIGWPDEGSICVVQRGEGCVVRTDAPGETFMIDCYPLCEVFIARRHGLVVFADFTDLVAYGADGLAWKSGRLAWDELHVVRLKGDTLFVTGYDPTADRDDDQHPLFHVDLRTGTSSDKPYPEPWNWGPGV